MNITIAKPNRVDIEFVLSRLSARNAKELQQIPEDEVSDVVHRVMGAENARAMYVDGFAECLMSLHDCESFGKCSWFLATEDWFVKTNSAMIKACRKQLTLFAREHGRFVSVSQSMDIKVERWFATMGYSSCIDLDPYTKVFVYEPRVS